MTSLFSKLPEPPKSGRLMTPLIEAFDWTSTALGPIETWDPALASAVRLILNASPAMCLLVGDGGVMIYNDAYIPIAARRHPASLGANVLEMWPEAADFTRNAMQEAARGNNLDYSAAHFVFHRNGMPEDVWLDLTYGPVRDERGVSIATLAILSEATDRETARIALAESKDQLVASNEMLVSYNEMLSLTRAASGAVGNWDWDIQADLVIADDKFADMYAVAREDARRGVPIGAFIKAVHPDDVGDLSRHIEDAIRACGEFRAEYRLIAADGAVLWVLAIGKVVCDAHGTAIRLPGVVIDITERKAAETALAASEAGFRALADSMPQMVWSTRPDGFHDYYNARWYEFTGMPEGSTDGEEWNGMFHPDDQERAWAEWRRSLATGEPYQIEYRLRHRSGEYRWTLGRALPARDEDGAIMRWFGTCTDIHESKLLAEEREVVAQELSHRIKNIFSVLAGIIALSARSRPDMKEFADQLRDRIAAMGKAHDLVRPHSKTSAPESHDSLRALFEQLIAPFEPISGGRFSFEGDDVAVDDASATPLALLFHELATNSAKYGALSRHDGRVTVTGRLNLADYYLSWTESGVPFTQPPKTEGFGSRLVQLSVERQLGGSLKRVWSSDGLQVEMRIPVDALRRSNRLAREIR